ncbi:DUF3592 domain-containing protein [Halospina denitrificans]
MVFGLLSPNWPTVTGRVLEAKIRTGRTNGGSGKKVYCPKVRYQYRANGMPRTGSRVSFGKYGTQWNSTANRDLVNERLDQYQPGEELTVYYCPQLPFVSVLDPGFSWVSVFLAVWGGGMVYGFLS